MCGRRDRKRSVWAGWSCILQVWPRLLLSSVQGLQFYRTVLPAALEPSVGLVMFCVRWKVNQTTEPLFVFLFACCGRTWQTMSKLWCAVGSCRDVLPNCDQYGPESCNDPYRSWAIDNCAKHCNLCCKPLSLCLCLSVSLSLCPVSYTHLTLPTNHRV